MNVFTRKCTDKKDIQYTVFSLMAQRYMYGVDLLILNNEMMHLLTVYFNKRHLTWKYYYDQSGSDVAFTIYTEFNSLIRESARKKVIVTFEELSQSQLDEVPDKIELEVITILSPNIKNDFSKRAIEKSVDKRRKNEIEIASHIGKEDDFITISLKSAKDFRDEPYSVIWSSLLEWTEDESEKSLLENLVDLMECAKDAEKPFGNVEVTKKNAAYVCDLYWKDRKLMYFSTCNYEDYCALKDADVKCIYGGDNSLEASDVVRMIRGI